MIPKIIHYCWVGNATKPSSVLYCIQSWKKYCPDYEIREWNESNYDFSKNKYMKQAYDAHKWGFVPDYARLDIIYQYGGIYLDTDVELIKSFDELLEQPAFMGFENTGDGEFFVNCGHGFGAEPHHEIVRAARDLYEDLEFLRKDGSFNMLPSPHYTTRTLKKYGLVQKNEDQRLPGMMVYASDVLCPKNFRTGKLHKTERTVSIHHFTASWLDEKIRKELEHTQKIKRIFGSRLGHTVLLGESVLEKYSLTELVTKLPGRLVGKAKRKIVSQLEMMPYYQGLWKAGKQPNGKEPPILLDTALESDNCGDQIIMECCGNHLRGILDIEQVKHIPTHRFATRQEQDELKKAAYKILCGTNILSGNMRSYGLWKLGPDVSAYKNTVLMGVGFDSESEKYDRYTKALLHTILHRNFLHSVRDRFSEQKLKSMGISNVIYTGCPTMWSLTPEVCRSIPEQKGTKVVCTVTDYNRDPDMDTRMFEVLFENYQTVYFWIQGKEDLVYLQTLGLESKVTCIPSSLQAYDAILQQEDLDYVGTRLHAGIRALSLGHRSVIIAIDNRARCISRDTGLPVIERSELQTELEEAIRNKFSTTIQMPWENIDRWKKQFQ
ncbi:MAG: polysaccharide pyruvyl transferase family protein [Gemmiger sp.]|uniref:polysaccharide pyruvyl transferase family protein n=1 Tax=Gemmiger sp. TaxID=2049027 RepID=UPI002E7A3E86|nr:polysaccharide pyruvyl transferase family protein [Gemmiger sp.]MEE0799903.1 polysaccharide pyruvyl transferase family protein [Gemmiger sp.]